MYMALISMQYIKVTYNQVTDSKQDPFKNEPYICSKNKYQQKKNPYQSTL